MKNITINTDRGYIGMILSATADAIRFAEREIEECPADAPEYREFVQGKLEHHRVLNSQIGTLFLRTRPSLSADNTEDDE
jgi:chemotaxis signal transduction protein